jgi:hypothetical protein
MIGVRDRRKYARIVSAAKAVLAVGLTGFLFWRLGPAGAIGASMIVIGRTIGAGRSTVAVQWLRTAARVRAAAVGAGVALLIAATMVQMPTGVYTTAQLRGAVAYLGVHSAAVIGAPLFAWISMQSLRSAARRGRRLQSVRTLKSMAKTCAPVRMKIAV